MQPNREENPELRSGRISALRKQKKSRDRLSVDIEGQFAFGIHADVLVDHPLTVGDHLSEARILRLLEEDAYYRARDRAYHLLSYRQRSSRELADRLSARGFPAGTVDRVLRRLEELELINDTSFAFEYALGRVRSKGFGPGRVRNELRRKGVQGDVIEAALENAYKEGDPEALALKAARKIQARLSRIDDANKRRRHLASYLSRRGFSYDQMLHALRALREDAVKE